MASATGGGEPSLSLPDRFKKALEACDSISLRRDTTPVVSELNAWKEVSPPLPGTCPLPPSSAAQLVRGAAPCCTFAPLASPLLQNQVPQDAAGADHAGFYQQLSTYLDPAADVPPRRGSWWLWAAIISLIMAAVGIFLKGKLFSFFARRKKERTDAEEEDLRSSELPYARRTPGGRAAEPPPRVPPPSLKQGVLPQSLCRSLPQKDEPSAASRRQAPPPPTSRRPQAAAQKKPQRAGEDRPSAAAAAPSKKVAFRPPTPEEVSDYEEEEDEEQVLAARPAASSSVAAAPHNVDPNFEEF